MTSLKQSPVYIIGYVIIVCLNTQELSAFINPTPVVFEDTHYVLKDRSKYIELRAFCEGGDNTVLDPDTMTWYMTAAPSNGTLTYIVGTTSTYKYVPSPSFTGYDEFYCKCQGPNTNYSD